MTNYKPSPVFCCEPFADAQCPGTDNEGHSQLIRVKDDGTYSIGCELPLAKYCPWCGVDRRTLTPPTATIFGSEITWTRIIPLDDVKDACVEMWEHPDRYSDYMPGTEDAYYKFLKFLWVRFPDGTERRLDDIANEA